MRRRLDSGGILQRPRLWDHEWRVWVCVLQRLGQKKSAAFVGCNILYDTQSNSVVGDKHLGINLRHDIVTITQKVCFYLPDPIFCTSPDRTNSWHDQNVIILLNRWSAVRTSSFNMRKRTRHSTVFYRIQPRFYWDHYLWWVIIVILLKAYWNHAVEVRRQIEIAISVICITTAHQLHFFYVLPVEQRKLIELRDGQRKGPSVCVLLTAWKIYTVHGGTNLPNWLLHQNHLHSHAQGSETNYKVLTRGMESFTAEQPANKIPIWLDLQ